MYIAILTDNFDNIIKDENMWPFTISIAGYL